MIYVHNVSTSTIYLYMTLYWNVTVYNSTVTIECALLRQTVKASNLPPISNPEKFLGAMARTKRNLEQSRLGESRRTLL